MNMNVIRVTDKGKEILLKLVKKELTRIHSLPVGVKTREDIDAQYFFTSLKETLE